MQPFYTKLFVTFFACLHNSRYLSEKEGKAQTAEVHSMLKYLRQVRYGLQYPKLKCNMY